MTKTDHKDTARVYFPCVHTGAAGLFSVTCFHSPEIKSIAKVVSGIDEEEARRVIGPARHNERDHRAANGVMVVFSNPLFSGRSYGLALAVADKIARYGKKNEGVTIYATGEISVDGCGKVKAIDSLPEKISFVLKKAGPGSIFLYSQDNMHQRGKSENTELCLEMLKKAGVQCIAVNHLDELEGVCWNSPSPPLENKESTLYKRLLAYLPMVSKIGIASAICIALILLQLQLHRKDNQEEENASSQTFGISRQQSNFSHQVIKKDMQAETSENQPDETDQDEKKKMILESADIDSGPY